MRAYNGRGDTRIWIHICLDQPIYLEPSYLAYYDLRSCVGVYASIMSHHHIS